MGPAHPVLLRRGLGVLGSNAVTGGVKKLIGGLNSSGELNFSCKELSFSSREPNFRQIWLRLYGTPTFLRFKDMGRRCTCLAARISVAAAPGGLNPPQIHQSKGQTTPKTRHSSLARR